MFFYPSKLNFLVIPMVSALMHACSTAGYYAPVKTDGHESVRDKKKPLISKPSLNKGNPVINSNIGTQQRIQSPRAFYSTDLSTGHDYQSLGQGNKKSPANNLTAVNKIPSDSEEMGAEKKQQNTAAKVTNTQPTKTFESATIKSSSTDRTAPIKLPTAHDLSQLPENLQKKSIASIGDKKMLELSFSWPIMGRVLKSFSPPRNKGIDIAGKNGQAVKATETGKVVYGGQGLRGFGKLLIIKHNDVYLSAYANNSRLLVNEGQYVKKGQVVAKVGDVGIKRTSLHFEIRKNGRPVNPLKLLPKI